MNKNMQVWDPVNLWVNVIIKEIHCILKPKLQIGLSINLLILKPPQLKSPPPTDPILLQLKQISKKTMNRALSLMVNFICFTHPFVDLANFYDRHLQQNHIKEGPHFVQYLFTKYWQHVCVMICDSLGVLQMLTTGYTYIFSKCEHQSSTKL